MTTVSDAGCPVVEAVDLSKTFPHPREPVTAVSQVTFSVAPGEFIAVTGRSGSGKTTLLNLLGLLDRPTAGTYALDGIDVTAMSERERGELRRSEIGFVFQEAYLIGTRNAHENVAFALARSGVARAARDQRARGLLRAVGLAHRTEAWPSTLSTGERQRVALARALAPGPRLLLCDEPTGNLDSETGAEVMRLLRTAPPPGCTVLLVTHDEELAEQADRRLVLADGELVADASTGAPADAATRAHRDTETGAGTRPQRVSTELPWRVRLWDYLDDVGLNVGRQPWRAFLATLGVLSGVGIFVFSVATGTTTAARVRTEFDLLAATAVQITDTASGGAPFTFPPTTDERLDEVPGVTVGGRSWSIGQRRLRAGPQPWQDQTQVLEVAAMSAGAFETLHAAVRGPGIRDGAWSAGSRVVLIGQPAATRLQAPVTVGQTVAIDGERFRIAGILTDVKRETHLLLGAIVPAATAEELWPSAYQRPRALVEVQPGAAAVVGRQAPLVLNPNDPDRLVGLFPPEAENLRTKVTTQVDTFVVVLAAGLIVASVFTVGSATFANVIERRHEIGLRRALGMQRSHIVSLILGETTLLAAISSLVGLTLALATFLTIAVSRGWTPVLPYAVILLAPVGGTVAGLMAGVIPAVHAARMEPADALRS